MSKQLNPIEQTRALLDLLRPVETNDGATSRAALKLLPAVLIVRALDRLTAATEANTAAIIKEMKR